MSNSNLISSIELTRKNLRAQIEGLRVEAEDLITKYWIKWKERNHQEINLTRHSKVPKREYLGSYAPKVELIGNARKVTITWHQFSPYKTRAPSHMSKWVQPMKSGKYSKNCFVNHASWEYEMISETEALLEPYREMLELYHSAYIELGRKIRQYSKTKVAQ
ncbi:plasmid transfer protein [Escherichia coli]|nr:plasmid transfer protein [Escherichia coli]